MIDQQQAANPIPGFLSLGLLFVMGVLVASFAKSLFWIWFNLLSLIGDRLAAWLSADRDLWVPKVPSTRIVRIEVGILRATGIFLAVCAVLILVVVLVE